MSGFQVVRGHPRGIGGYPPESPLPRSKRVTPYKRGRCVSIVTRGMPNLRPFYVLIAACLTYDQVWLTAIVKFLHFVLVHLVFKTQFLLPDPPPPSGLKHPPFFTSLEVLRRIRHQKTQARKRAQIQPLKEEWERLFQLCQAAAPSKTVYGNFIYNGPPTSGRKRSGTCPIH